jgi:rhodanese-related sulfurtransferase
MFVAWSSAEPPTLGGGLISHPLLSFEAHMPCLCKSTLGQVIAIIAIGSAIGIADSLARPVKLTREAPPPIIPTPATPNSNPPSPIPTPAAAPTFVFATEADLKSKPGQITVAAAKALFDQQAIFIDARKLDPYKLDHVKGAFRMAEEDFQFGNPPMLAAIPRDATLVVYCSGGNCDESEQVAKLINGAGYQKVYVMHDGIPGWLAMSYPSEKGEGQ